MASGKGKCSVPPAGSKASGARYFRPDDRGAVPWHRKLESDRHYRWDVAPKSGIAEPVEVDPATQILLAAVEVALDTYCDQPPPQATRAGVFIEMLAEALEARGGIGLTFGFRLGAADESSIPARPC